MNKILLTFVAFLCFTLSINASNSNDDGKYKFTVTVTTEKVYYYYENYTEVGRETKLDKTYTIEVWADTPNEAENKAINKCSTMCSTGFEKEGMKTYKGKLYECRSKTRVFQANAKVAKI